MDKISGLEELAVRSADGKIDVSATLTAIGEQLLARAEYEDNLGERIATAVHSVFDANLGKTLASPAVANFAATAMGVTPSNYAELTAAIGLWVRHSPEFKVSKGKGGGCARKCDAKPEETK